MNETVEYRYRSSDTQGIVSVFDGHVHSTIYRTFTKWTFPTPLAAIDPNAIRTWTTPSAFWICAGISVCGILGVVSDAIASGDDSMSPWLAATIVPLCIGLFAYSLTVRREEWLVFPTSINGHWIRYCRGGPDRDRFDSFTAYLTDQIRNARTPSSG